MSYSVDEIKNLVYDEVMLSHELLQFFKDSKRDDMIQLHHSFGRYIRNKYDLWSRTWVPDLIDGVDYSKEHPDAISMDIIESIWDKIND